MLKKLNMVVSVLALLALALAGCKNGLLTEEEATVNGQRGVGSRTVEVTVTNFETGMSRAIAPGQLTGTELSGTGYKFVAKATSTRTTKDPVLVTITQDGKFTIPDLTSGVWTVELIAYSVGKLNGLAGNVDQNDPKSIYDNGDTAKVLSGKATVDLTSTSSTAKITLTPRDITGNGSVKWNIKIHDDDVTKIEASNYTVKVGLYNKQTGEPVPNATEQTPTITSTNKTNAHEFTDIPKGEYLFKVTITDPNQATSKRGPWSYTDVLSTEPNRETTLGTDTVPFDLPKLIGAAPAAPEKFTVYWDTNEVDANDLSYTATFAWDRKSYNELGFKLEIADITDYFDPSNDMYEGQPGVKETITSNENLWTKITDGQHPITTLTKDNFTSRDNAPIIYGGDGALLAGNTLIKYKLPAGRLYAARLSATNADGESGVAYAGNTQGVAPGSRPNGATYEEIIRDSNQNPDVLLFDVFAVTYDLEGKFALVKEGEQTTSQDSVKGKSVKFHVYNSQTPTEIDYKINSAGQVQQNGYWLLRANDTAQASATTALPWTKWVDQANPGTPATGYTNNDSYSGHKNIVLITDASGSGNGTVDVESSGTYSGLLTKDTLLISSGADAAPAQPLGNGDKFDTKTTNGTDVSTGTAGATQTGSLGFAGAARIPAVNMPINNTNHATAYHLYFAVGGEVEEEGGQGPAFKLNKLQLAPALDQTKRVATVKSATYTLETSTGTIVKTVTSDSTSVASMNITGLEGGNYVLRAVVRFTSGWPSSFQTPFILKYTNDTVN